MRRIPSYLICLTLGAVIVTAPSLTNIGSDSIYDSALAEKGGNGNGKGNSGNKGGNKSAAASAASAAGAGGATNGSRQKSKDKQLAVTDLSALAHPSMLGRWNAAKPIDHPAIQAHIRNGKFNGTIGMVAAYAQAQANYDTYQQGLADLSVTDPAAAALASALIAAGYTSVEQYQAAVLAGEAAPVAAIDTALAPTTTTTTTGETTTTPMSDAQIQAAEDLATLEVTAFSDLTAAEANMEAYSNRAPWGEIRDAVRAKMELDPAENDLVTEAPVDPTAPLTP
jgi:hypothetical protein